MSSVRGGRGVPGVPGSERIRVTIDARTVEVEAGTMVVAALAIAGLRGTRASVGGQARAALCGMGVCQECRVTIDGRAHALACQTLCRDGQIVRTRGGV
jgi:predicted molibdopterin-dependent oxidoreductase YjgC